MNHNFKWLEYDIDNSLILKVLYNDNDYAVFNVLDVLEVTGDKLDVETANIDDLTNLLTIGMVRFYNLNDSHDIIDIPLRNLYKLYYKDNTLLNELDSTTTSFKELDAFSIIDGTVTNDYKVLSYVIANPTDDLNKVMMIASKFASSGMQEKFNLMSEVTMINHRRLKSDNELLKTKR